MDHRSKNKTKTIKFSRRNVREEPCDLGLGKNFLFREQKLVNQ